MLTRSKNLVKETGISAAGTTQHTNPGPTIFKRNACFLGTTNKTELKNLQATPLNKLSPNDLRNLLAGTTFKTQGHPIVFSTTGTAPGTYLVPASASHNNVQNVTPLHSKDVIPLPDDPQGRKSYALKYKHAFTIDRKYIQLMYKVADTGSPLEKKLLWQTRPVLMRSSAKYGTGNAIYTRYHYAKSRLGQPYGKSPRTTTHNANRQ